MATPGETVPLNSQAAGGKAEASSDKALLAPPQTAAPVKAVHRRTVENIKREVEKMEGQIDADKAEMESLRKRIEVLEGERVFESKLFQSSRELINMRYARGLTPLSSTEAARLKEIQDHARHTMNQYENAKGNLPAFVGRSFGQFPTLL